MGHRRRRNYSLREQKHAQLHQLAKLLWIVGPRPLRHVDQSPGARNFLAAVSRRHQLDALPEWNLDSRRAPRMDLGKQRAVGMDALSFWNLATLAHAGLGLDSGRARGTSPLGTCARELGARGKSSGMGGEKPQRSRWNCGESCKRGEHEAGRIFAGRQWCERNLIGESAARRDAGQGAAAGIRLASIVHGATL